MEVVKDKVKPRLGRVKMVCDCAIDPKLEEQGEAVKACFSRPNFTIFSGGMGAGKTSMVISLLKGAFKKTMHNMYVVIPEGSLHSISPADNVFLKHLPEDSLYHDLTDEILEDIYEKAVANSAAGEYTHLIVDDYGQELKTKPIMKQLERLVVRMRHLKLGAIWVLCQNYYQMPKKLRELATNIFLWNTNKSQNQKFFAEQFQLGEEKFLELMRHCPTAHDWILLNLKYKRIFNNDWDEVRFRD